MTGNRQRIIFIEPHGMLQAPSYANDEKAQLHERLPALAKEISQRSEDPNVKVRLDSYIVSQTSFDDLRMRYDPGDWSREDFARRHILFPCGMRTTITWSTSYARMIRSSGSVYLPVMVTRRRA